MKKISENILLKQKDGLLELTQTGQDFTYKEIIPAKSSDEALVCVDTQKFLVLFDEEKSELTFKDDFLEIKTGRSKGSLPYMKEGGIFQSEKEIELDGKVIDEFEADYSGVDLELVDAFDQFSYVLFNRQFACRYLYNTLSFYDQLPEEWYNITPRQFKLLKTLGRCKIEVYENGLKAITDQVIVLLKLYSPVVNLAVIRRFFSLEPRVTFNFIDIDYKRLKVFLKEADAFNLKRLGNQIKFSIPGYDEEFEAENFSSDEEIDLTVFKHDLENLAGEIQVYKMSGVNYFITHPEETKTVLFACEG